MTKIIPVAETFESYQGEGRHAFTPMFFIRLAGCNLKCSFCDTDHRTRLEYAVEELVSLASRSELKCICITGGEPTIHPLLRKLVQTLLDKGHKVYVETNGVEPIPDLPRTYISCSPKEIMDLTNLDKVNEWKVLIPTYSKWVHQLRNLDTAAHKFVQPIDPGGRKPYLVRIKENLELCEPYLREGWKLSLQWHKVFGWQ